MEAWFLREWQRNSPWQILLRPLSWVFALLAYLRRMLYRVGVLARERVGVPVVVIGNITVGGTGKTPVVLALVEHFARAGIHCGIVSRGYSRDSNDHKLRKRGAGKFLIRVVPDPAEPTVISDEATLLAQRCGVPVYVSADRVAAARALLQEQPEVNVIISDDGLQHYALHRDVEICVIDGVRAFGNGALLPAGPLREPAARLNEVDAIIMHGAASAAGRIIGQVQPDCPVFAMSLGRESLLSVKGDKALTIGQAHQEFSAKRVLAVAGIGNPARFFDHIAGLGFSPAEARAFPDHHPYRAEDFAGVSADIILMTEKDAVKCRAFADERMWYVRVDAVLPDAFGEFIAKRLSELKK